MVEPSRYNMVGDESNILNNKLGIANPKTLEDTETILLSDTYSYFFELLEKDELQFDLDLLFEIHRYFLSPLYLWAGKIRTVNISKDGILFIPAKFIEKSMKELKGIINKNLPSDKDSKKEIANKLSIIHCEFNMIHPFREGNGRVIRLFLDLLAFKLGCEIIGFGKTAKKKYIEACIAGMNKKYEKMCKIIYKGLKGRA